MITRLTAQWQDEAKAFGQRDLSGVDYVYLWVDGIHLGVRLDEEKLCLLVMIGVRVDGTKELDALADGYRESTGSWADLLRDCKRHMPAPVLRGRRGAEVLGGEPSARWMTGANWSIVVASQSACLSGRVSWIHISRLRPSPSGRTCIDVLSWATSSATQP